MKVQLKWGGSAQRLYELLKENSVMLMKNMDLAISVCLQLKIE